MNSILNKNVFLVKEHVGMFKAANNFDIYDPENNQIIMQCREENLGFFTKMFRFTDYKRMTSFDLEVKTATGAKVLRVKRGITIFRSDVQVFDEKDRLIGTFKQQFFSFGGKFNIFDANQKPICTLHGKWTGWDFKFMKEQTELAHVTKKWAGFGKEFFTSADNYVLKINDTVSPDDSVRSLVLAAILCIDMVLKE